MSTPGGRRGSVLRGPNGESLTLG